MAERNRVLPHPDTAELIDPGEQPTYYGIHEGKTVFRSDLERENVLWVHAADNLVQSGLAIKGDVIDFKGKVVDNTYRKISKT